MRLLLSSYSFFIKAPSAAVCKALISLVFYYHPYQSLANKGFLIYAETSRSPLLLYVVESGGSKILV